MDGSSQITEPITSGGLESNNVQSHILDDNQLFLLYFIMGTYFGPDLKGERLQKSVLQRIAEGLPPYTSDHLAGTHMKTVEVERVYYYVLRKAAESVTVKLPLLYQFFEGNVPAQGQDPAANYPQFPDLFPLQLHPHSRFKNRHKIIENIVFINNPEIVYIKPEDIERFKRLTGLEDFLLDSDAARLHTSIYGAGLHNAAVQEDESNRELPSPSSSRGSQKTRRIDDILNPQDHQQHFHFVAPISSVPYSGKPMMYSYMASLPTKDDSNPMEKVGPAMIFLPSHPTKKEWTNIVAATKSGFALTGSAAMGQVGPVIGLMDIGECDDSYLFRVSLPGVKRDEREFSCEVEIDGKVLIQGVTTTGEKTVYRYSQVFEMQTQNLCPPGHFSISFQLPGPVDPQQFCGNFGTDGVLEGIVMKGRHQNDQ
ncbi:increased DNA methylation 2-like [Quercus lobata]|uniref:SHSP domain-containing protein n=1 Tax=Quercus lobata TaxID=97700 RepID=A0A7N2L4K5_QUELO|nr:increased DNA methylation 2-like [Quercus lobata]